MPAALDERKALPVHLRFAMFEEAINADLDPQSYKKMYEALTKRRV